MSDPRIPPQNITFHNDIRGGQQAFASHNTVFNQYNASAGPAETMDALVQVLRDHLAEFRDPQAAGREVEAIEVARVERRADKAPVLEALQTLTVLATAGTTVADAVAKATDLVSRYWPF